MSSYPKPPREYAIFDPTIFNVSRYLEYPIAQGAETLQAISVKGIAIFQAFANFQGILVNGIATFSSYVTINGISIFNAESIFNSFIRIKDIGNQSTIDQSSNTLIIENEVTSGIINLQTHNSSGTITTPLQLTSASSTFSNDVNFNNNLYIKDGSNNTLIDQSSNTLTIENQTISGIINLQTHNSSGTITTPISITSPLITMNSATDFIDVINSKNSINIYDSSNLTKYSIIDQIGNDLVVNNNVNSGYINFTAKNSGGTLLTPLQISTNNSIFNSNVSINNGYIYLYDLPNSSDSYMGQEADNLVVRNEVNNGSITFYVKDSLGTLNNRFKITSETSSFFNNLEIRNKKLYFYDLTKNSYVGQEVDNLVVRNEVNNGSIAFYVKDSLGTLNNRFKIISNTSSFYNNLEIRNKNLYFYDATDPTSSKYGQISQEVDNLVLYCKNNSGAIKFATLNATGDLAERMSIDADSVKIVNNLDINGGYIYLYDLPNNSNSSIRQENVYLVTRNNRVSGQLAFQTKDSLGNQTNRLIISSDTSYFYNNLEIRNKNLFIYDATNPTSSKFGQISQEGDNLVLYSKSNSGAIKFGTLNANGDLANRMSIDVDSVKIENNLDINSGVLYFKSTYYSDSANKIILYDNGGSGRYGFGIGNNYNINYIAGGQTNGKHIFYVGGTSTTNGAEKFRIDDTTTTLQTNLSIAGDIITPLDINTTGITGSNYILELKDTTFTNKLNVYLKLGNGTHNPLTNGDNISIIAGGAIDSKTLMLGVNSSICSGLRLSYNQVMLGAGSVYNDPSYYFSCQPANSKNVINGQTHMNNGSLILNGGFVYSYDAAYYSYMRQEGVNYVFRNDVNDGTFVFQAKTPSGVNDNRMYISATEIFMNRPLNMGAYNITNVNTITANDINVNNGILKINGGYIYLYDGTKYSYVDQEGDYIVVSNEVNNGQIAFFVKNTAGTSANRFNLTSANASFSTNITTSDHLYFYNGSNYTYVGQETTHLVFRNEMNSGYIYFRTKTNTGAVKESVIYDGGIYISGGTLSIFELATNDYTGLGIDNPYNTNGRISISGIGGQTFTEVNQFSATKRVRFRLGNLGPTARADTTIVKFRVTFTCYNSSNFCQTSFNIDFFPYRWTQGSRGANQLYNVNNKINGNATFTYSNAIYAPLGRQYYTYNQTFTGITGENGCFYAENDYWTLYFAMPSNDYTYSGCVEALDTTDSITWTESVKLEIV